MNNITNPLTHLVNIITNIDTTRYNSNYLPANNTQINDFPRSNLYDRKLTAEPYTKLTELPDTLLDMIVCKLGIKDICNISLVCKKLFYLSRYYVNNFHIAHNLFEEYPAITQKKIIRLFNKNNYNKHLKPWLANFSDMEHKLNYLDGIQNTDKFCQCLFFYITKTIQQSTNIKVMNKFTSTYDDIVQSVGYSSNNTSLFIAYFSGLIKIYALDKNKNFIPCQQIYLDQQIDFAKFSPDGYSIVIGDLEKKITIIYSTKDNNWEIERNTYFVNLQASSIIFTPNSKFMIAIYQNMSYFFNRPNRLNKWQYLYTFEHANTLTVTTCSYDSLYCARGENNGLIAIDSLQNIATWSPLDIQKHNAYITNISFSINNEFLASTAADNSTNIYLLKQNCEKIFSITTEKQDEPSLNFKANACFSNDSNTVLVNHGENITIVSNLLFHKNITSVNCKLTSNLNKACISNNSNYIIIYTQEDTIIKLYTKNDMQQWFNIKDIDTKVKVKLVRFSANEHHFVAISSKKTVVYNFFNCKQLVKISKVNSLVFNNNTKRLANKKLKPFAIETLENAKKHIIFNPYFCQLLISYNNVIKIYTPNNNHLWNKKLTLKMDMSIETVQYTNNGSHILINKNNDNQSNVALLAIN